jgi:hypothetical protein
MKCSAGALVHATVVADRAEGVAQARAQVEEQERITKLAWLAEESLHLLQLEEALGRPPTMKEFGGSSFEYRSVVLGSSVEDAWERYTSIVDIVLKEPV